MQPLVSRGALERMQWAALFYHVPPKEIAIIGDPDDPATKALVREVYRRYLPNKVVAIATPEEAGREDPDAHPSQDARQGQTGRVRLPQLRLRPAGEHAGRARPTIGRSAVRVQSGERAREGSWHTDPRP